MDISIFEDKTVMPTNEDLKNALGSLYGFWKQLRDYAFEKYPKAVEEWNFPGAKYGWSFRVKDKKRAIIYLLPRKGSFMAAMVFGQKATDEVFSSGVSELIKKELKAAKPYAEGRGIRIEVGDIKTTEDFKKLIDIKIAN